MGAVIIGLENTVKVCGYYINHWQIPWFFVFSSPEPKAQVTFSDQNVSVVRRRCCCRCRKLFDMFIFFSRTTGPISTKPRTKPPWVKEIQVCSNEGSRPFPRGDNYTYSENTLTKFENLLLKNHRANFKQTWHKASLREGDLSLFKWRASPFFKGR